MHIIEPEGISLANNLCSLLEDVEKERQALEDLGGFSAEVKEEIYRAFLPDRISDTLNMEGIQVNPRITKAILKGRALSEVARSNEQAILHVIKAHDLISELGPPGARSRKFSIICN